MRRTRLFLLAAALSAVPACAPHTGGALNATRTADAAPSAGSSSNAAPASSPNVAANAAAQPDLARYFEKFPGTFVLYDLKRDRHLRHDPARAAKRFSPFSTYKIPNSLIGLETGVVADASHRLKWDEKKHPPERTGPPFDTWWRDHTLRSAFRNSVLWYYREVAERVGEERMREFVTKFRYGNEDTSGGLTRFWLGDTLRISADEQVEFLKRLYKEELPVSKRTYAVFKDIFVYEQGAGYKLSAKTGGGPLRGEASTSAGSSAISKQKTTSSFRHPDRGPHLRRHLRRTHPHHQSHPRRPRPPAAEKSRQQAVGSRQWVE